MIETVVVFTGTGIIIIPVSVFTQHDKLYQQLQHFCQHSENGLDELISLCLKPFSD